MLEYSVDRIEVSLTELPTDLEQIAVSNFLDVLRCMGDKPTTFKGDLQDPIIQNAKKDAALADEVFVQVIKQLSGNYSSRSLNKGWELLHALCGQVLPSHELGEFLRAFLQNRAESHAE